MDKDKVTRTIISKDSPLPSKPFPFLVIKNNLYQVPRDLPDMKEILLGSLFYLKKISLKNIFDKIKIFSCGHCEYQVTSNKTMEINNSAFPVEEEKYNCDLCGHQVSHKNNLARHKKIVHEAVKYPCRQCNYQATTKGSLAEHKTAVHEGVNYPCGQCSHRATSKRGLAKTKKGST